jgi:hypothetical protein
LSIRRNIAPLKILRESEGSSTLEDRLATLPENIVAGRRSRVGAEEVSDGRFLPQSVLFEFLGRSPEMEISAVKVLAA